MGYGRPLNSAARVETLGITNGEGVTVTANATAGVYGNLATIGTTGFQYDGFLLQIQVFNVRNWKFTVTASTSGGADETVAEDVCLNISGSAGAESINLPIRIPSGAVVKIKGAASVGSSGTRASLVGYQAAQGINRGFSRAVSLTDFGSNSVYPANSITLNGTTLTGWSELRASTPNTVDAIGLCFATFGQTFGSNLMVSVELGYGAGGSETGTGILTVVNAGGSSQNTCPISAPYNIPAGTRLAMRAQANAADTHTCGITAWGFQR